MKYERSHKSLNSYSLVEYNKIYPNNLPLWQSVTQPQQTNEHMREVINHSTDIHLLNTIKSILTQTLEKLCKKRVYGKNTFTTCISETL